MHVKVDWFACCQRTVGKWWSHRLSASTSREMNNQFIKVIEVWHVRLDSVNILYVKVNWFAYCLHHIIWKWHGVTWCSRRLFLHNIIWKWHGVVEDVPAPYYLKMTWWSWRLSPICFIRERVLRLVTKTLLSKLLKDNFDWWAVP